MYKYVQQAKSDKDKVSSAKNISYIRERIIARVYNFFKDKDGYQGGVTRLTNEISMNNTTQALVEECGGTGILALIPGQTSNKLRSLGPHKTPILFKCLLQHCPGITDLCRLVATNLKTLFLSGPRIPTLRLEATTDFSGGYLMDLFQNLSAFDTPPAGNSEQLASSRPKRKETDESNKRRRPRPREESPKTGYEEQSR